MCDRRRCDAGDPFQWVTLCLGVVAIVLFGIVVGMVVRGS
jgi:hypothetical protein